MTTQTPMTAEQVFGVYDFRTNEGRDWTKFYFSGHLTAQQIVDTYHRTYPEPPNCDADALDTAKARRTWHVFTEHEDNCASFHWVKPGDELSVHDFCTCAAWSLGEYEGLGYEYRHPHPATADTPGAIPVTWVNTVRQQRWDDLHCDQADTRTDQEKAADRAASEAAMGPGSTPLFTWPWEGETR